MSHPLPENSPQVSLVQRNQEIQTLAADTCDEAFAESVRLGRVERRFQDAQAHRLQGRIELAGVNVVAVVDEEPVRFLSRDGLPELLERPVRGGMSGGVAVSGSHRAARTLSHHFHLVLSTAWGSRIGSNRSDYSEIAGVPEKSSPRISAAHGW